MSNETLVASASITIDAPKDKVWDALVDPKAIKQYMFGTNVTSDFREGGPITWKGEWQGREYEDKGTVLQAKPGEVLQYTHFSPLAGLPDKPENYHTVTINLSPDGGGTRVSLSQDNNPTEEEKKHSEDNWKMMLGKLKEYLEG